MSKQSIGAVVLAAGSARRFGADKRLQTFAESTVAQTTISKYNAVFDEVRVVVRDESDPLFTELVANKSLRIVFSPESHLGMGHSLAAGFKDLTWDYAFLALADMPLISIATLELLKHIGTEDIQRIIRPQFEQDKRGHPIGFPRRFFDELSNCQGDEGARHILASHSDHVRFVECNDRGVIQDIDTPAALAEARSQNSSGPNLDRPAP